MLALSPLLLLTLASSVLASPLSSLPLETRHSVGRLSPEQRKELASRIAVELFANQEPTKVDNEQLEKDVAAWLEDVREQSAVEKRLFGFGDSRDDNQGNYGPVKGNCPSDTQFVRVSEVRPTVPPLMSHNLPYTHPERRGRKDEEGLRNRPFLDSLDVFC
jgi:hypothetical protein